MTSQGEGDRGLEKGVQALYKDLQAAYISFLKVFK